MLSFEMSPRPVFGPGSNVPAMGSRTSIPGAFQSLIRVVDSDRAVAAKLPRYYLALMQTRYSAVLLDALGTLVELEPPWPLLRRTLELRHGIEVTDAEAKQAVLAEMSFYRAHHHEGRDEASLAELRRRCALVLGERLPAAAALSAEELTEALLDSLRFTPFPDAAPALAQLRAAGLRLAVVSNWDCSLTAVLGGLGLAAAVDAIVVSAEVGARKPDPRIFRVALEQLGCEAGKALFVGDSLETDVLGARAAGLRALLLDRTANAPGEHGAESIASLAELVALAAPRQS
jgi:putative hydrolase of the HAD superfamily